MRDDDPRHGSSGGYYAHRRAGQVPCAACKAAESEYQRRYKLGYRRADNVAGPTHIDSDDALTGGQWVRDGLILRWQHIRAVHTPSDRGPVVCDCGARATETCRTENGNRTRPHSYRTSPQVCPCGEPLAWKCRVCSTCRKRLDEDRKKAWKNEAANGLGKTRRSSPLSPIAGTMDGEGTDKKSAPERRANAIAQGPRRPVRKEPTDSWTA